MGSTVPVAFGTAGPGTGTRSAAGVTVMSQPRAMTSPRGNYLKCERCGSINESAGLPVAPWPADFDAASPRSAVCTFVLLMRCVTV